jgi:hypothetical protein
MTDGAQDARNIKEHSYLRRFDGILYSVDKKGVDGFIYKIAGLVDWHKSIELDVIEDELLLSIP